MLVTSRINNPFCKKCAEAATHAETHFPYFRLIVNFVGSVIILMLLVGSVMGVGGGYLQDPTLSAVVRLTGVGLTVAGAVCLLFCGQAYWQHNVRGYTLYAALTYEGQVHVHRYGYHDDHELDLLVTAEIPITDSWRLCKIGRCAFPGFYQMTVIAGIFGVHVRLYRNGNYFELREYETALWLFAAAQDLSVIAGQIVPNYSRILRGALVLERVTAPEDPIGLGRSRHGQTTQRHLKKMLEGVSQEERENFEPEVKKIVDDLVRMRREEEGRKTGKGATLL